MWCPKALIAGESIRSEPFAPTRSPELASRRVIVTLKSTASSVSPLASATIRSVVFVRPLGLRSVMATDSLSSAARREASCSHCRPSRGLPSHSLVILRKMLRRQFDTSSPKHGRMRYHTLEFGSM